MAVLDLKLNYPRLSRLIWSDFTSFGYRRSCDSSTHVRLVKQDSNVGFQDCATEQERNTKAQEANRLIGDWREKSLCWCLLTSFD